MASFGKSRDKKELAKTATKCPGSCRTERLRAFQIQKSQGQRAFGIIHEERKERHEVAMGGWKRRLYSLPA